MIRDIVRVEGVGRVAGRQHHVVGDIHQSVDGAHASLPDPVLHLVGGRLHSHAGHLHADIPGAAVRIRDIHMEIRLHVCRIGLDFLKGQAVQGRDLPGDAVMAPEIRAVGHGLVVNLQQDVVHVQGVCQRGSRGNVKGRQVENLRLLRCREQIAQADFAGGADHAEGLHAPKLGVFNDHRLALSVPAHHRARTGDGHPHALPQVDTAADDVLDLAVSDVCLADSQLVRVGMGLDLLNHAHHHMIKTPGQILHILYLHGRHGQIVGQLFQIQILRDLDKILNPR